MEDERGEGVKEGKSSHHRSTETGPAVTVAEIPAGERVAWDSRMTEAIISYSYQPVFRNALPS
ncbi:hypothetical protein E2C01_065496 [Portunus trituberculatus]|uniref:Uncharacterized protein n=1 Tax=Portunus trituberculatus TaxID=210409 RepID=A0A5B7HRW7_PORTR|nr:hypothetical protein [Portunus trituberculatus]